MHISVLNGALWDMEQTHCWIFEIRLLITLVSVFQAKLKQQENKSKDPEVLMPRDSVLAQFYRSEN